MGTTTERAHWPGEAWPESRPKVRRTPARAERRDAVLDLLGRGQATTLDVAALLDVDAGSGALPLLKRLAAEGLVHCAVPGGAARPAVWAKGKAPAPVERVATLLDRVREALTDGPATSAALARRFGVRTSSVHNALKTLEERGVVACSIAHVGRREVHTYALATAQGRAA
jgi:Mn-dependent DtxR family transcriptional regulator